MALLTGDKATGIAAVDEIGFSRWPHLFNVLAERYPVPDHLLITLLWLWNGTVGRNAAGSGDLAVAQVPVRERNVRKWLKALCAVGFFETDGVEPGDRTGATFTYKKDTSPDAWRQFFEAAAFYNHFPNWDAVSPERFAAVFARAFGKQSPPAATLNATLNAR
jgi:hypothetical protein